MLTEPILVKFSRCLILIPIRGNTDIYEDAMALFRFAEVDWVRCENPGGESTEPIRAKPETIVNREKKRQEKLRKIKQEKPATPPEETLLYREAAVIDQFRSWSSCSVPLSVVANK